MIRNTVESFAPYVYNVRVVGANSSKRYASEPESDKYTRCKTPGIARKSSGCAFAILHTLIPFRCLERFIISVRALAHRKPSLGMYTARQCALSNAEHFFFLPTHRGHKLSRLLDAQRKARVPTVDRPNEGSVLNSLLRLK
ncbi:hypothetical protein MRX96_048913 [Rhipicephalus microplus]